MPRDASLLEKPLPSNLDAEKVVLGSVITDNSLMVDAVEILRPEDFYSPRHRRVFGAMLVIFGESGDINPVSITEATKKDGDPVPVSEIASLVIGLPYANKIDSYLATVKEKAVARRVIKQCAEIQSKALSEEMGTDELLDFSEQSIGDIRELDKAEVRFIGDLVTERSLQIAEIQRTGAKILGLETGFIDLDYKLGGVQRGKNIILAGRPSMGKSALALNIIDGITEKDPDAVCVFFSMEMSGMELTDRLLCSHAKVNSHNFAVGMFTSEESGRLAAAATKLHGQRIFILDTPNLTVLEAKTHLRRIKRKEGRLDVAVFDHLGLMGSDPTKKYEGRFQDISRNARAMKPIAKDFNITTLVLSQLNRAAETRNPPKPILSDLRETGDIEQEADVVCLLYREEYYRPTDENTGVSELIVAKNRGGPTGNVKLAFLKEYTRFENYYAD